MGLVKSGPLPYCWAQVVAHTLLPSVDVEPVWGGAERMLMDELHARKHLMEALGARYGARRIRVFGSVARGEERADSDVDFVVEFDRGYDMCAQRLPLARQ